MADFLSIDRLTAGYDGTVIIEEISLSLAPQTTLAILGRNGVGKTTLLAALMGLAMPLSGRIRLGGAEITHEETHARARAGLGYVPQEREIFSALTVEENLSVAARPGHWTVPRVYELFPHLAERRRNYGNDLSGGEQQMLAIGRALMGNPTLLLMDEPFEGLAPVLIDELVDAFERIRRDYAMAMLLVEHNVEIALGLAEQSIVLDRGRIVWEGASVVLARDPKRLAALIGLEPAQ
ncbi:MAG: ABC transporter ATP-binding protein [Proteobacteria bacterium]|nr:ABC transporter ATP-binding protein [Pseudomonadota bacterium]